MSAKKLGLCLCGALLALSLRVNVEASVVADGINEGKQIIYVSEKPNMPLEIKTAKNKKVNKYRVSKMNDGRYRILISYYSLKDVSSIAKKIDAYTKETWGQSLTKTKHPVEAITQYLIANDIEYNTNNYDPNRLLADGGSCQAISLFISEILDYCKIPNTVLTGSYDNVAHMWLYANGVMKDPSFALESKDIQYAIETDPTIYKCDNETIAIGNVLNYTSIDGKKILYNGSKNKTYSLDDKDRLWCLQGGRKVLLAKKVKDFTLSGGEVSIIYNDDIDSVLPE